MKYQILLAIFAVCCYFIGNVNFALIISKFKHKDIRKMGSGNPGTLNMSRNLGMKIGILTFLLDILKGAIPSLVAYFVFYKYNFGETSFSVSDFAMYACGLCVILGHIFPVFLKFKGGKGIASTVGICIVCTAVHGVWVLLALLSVVAAIVFIYRTEFGGMGSFIAITPSLIFSAIFLYVKYGYGNPETPFLLAADACIFAIFFFTWFAHRKNIFRMLNGTEHPTSIKKMAKKKEKSENDGSTQA